MVKPAILISLVLLSASCCIAQDKKPLDSIDNVIIQQIIHPAEQNAGDQEPAWAAISLQVKASYSEIQADRAITKAQIYHYWSRNWPKFSTAIVHYTEAYEDKNDLPLMNKNAAMILQHSENKDELRTALSWVKHAVDKEPSNTTYQQTYQALSDKTNK